MSIRRVLNATGAALVGSVVWLAVAAAPAAAHIDAESASDPSGITTVTFAFGHGCDAGESATVALRVQLPPGASEVRPENPAGWGSEVSGEEFAWSGGSIPFDQAASFDVSMRIPGEKGDTVFLPTIQECEGGASESWIAKSDDPEAENAAPRIVLGVSVTAPTPEVTTPEGTTQATATSAPVTPTVPTPSVSIGGEEVTATSQPAPAEEDDSDNGLLIALAVAGAAVVVGGIWLLRSRRSDPPPAGDPGTSGGAPGPGAVDPGVSGGGEDATSTPPHARDDP